MNRVLKSGIIINNLKVKNVLSSSIMKTKLICGNFSGDIISSITNVEGKLIVASDVMIAEDLIVDGFIDFFKSSANLSRIKKKRIRSPKTAPSPPHKTTPPIGEFSAI